MEQINIPNTKITASSICLGTDYFGSSVPKETAFAMMDIYRAAGGTVLDTARIYGREVENGASERTIGAYLKERSCRKNVTIITKCAHPAPGQMDISRLSPEEIEADIDESLKALGIDVIDLLFLHRDDITIPVDGIIETLNRMVKKGKIRAFGASNWKAERIFEANRFAKKNKLMGFCASQIKWSLAKTNPAYPEDPTLVEMNNTELARYQEENFPVFAFASQAKGFFQKYKAGGEKALSEKAAARYLFQENISRYARVKVLANELNTTVSAVVLAYLVSQPGLPVFPIIGCKTPEQLENSLTDCGLTFTPKTLRFLETGK